MTNPTSSSNFLQIIVVFVWLTRCVTEVPLFTTSLRDNNGTWTTTDSSISTQLENSTQTQSNNSSNSSSTTTLPKVKGFPELFKNNSAILRGVYVACGFVVVVILYNLIMTRLRRKKNKLQLYGLLKSHSDVEMTPLGQGGDDEETTMFDASMFKSARS